MIKFTFKFLEVQLYFIVIRVLERVLRMFWAVKLKGCHGLLFYYVAQVR